MVAFKKSYRKKTGFKPRKVVKRKRVYRKRSSVAGLARVVRSLQKVAIGEKKMIENYLLNPESPTLTTVPIGLVSSSANNEAGGLYQLYPTLVKGTGRSDRIGNRVNLHSGLLNIHLCGQSAQAMNTKIHIQLFRVMGEPYAYTSQPASNWSTVGADMFKIDPIIGLRSATSAIRNPNYFKQFRVVAQRTIYTPQDNGSSSNFIKSLTIPIRFRNQVIQYDDGNNVISGQYFLVVRCSNGNSSAVSASTISNLGLNTAINTGFNMTAHMTWYYYDN